MHSLEKRLEMERSIHHEDNLRIMYMNMELIKHIIELRKEVVKKDRLYKSKNNELKELKSKLGEPSTLQPAISNDSLT